MVALQPEYSTFRPASCAARAVKCQYPIPSENGTRFVIVGTMRFGSTQAGGGHDVMVVRTTVVVVVVGVGHGVYGGGGEVISKNCRKVLLDLYAKQISSPPV
jgi:hypothetical protein